MLDDSTVENRRLSLKIWILSCLFGIGSWVAMNGLWVELPNLIYHLPEEWKLPSYMTIIVQLANVGPITYALLKNYCFNNQKERLEHVTILFVLIGGIIGCVLLACFWQRTTYVFGDERSTAFLALTFMIALVDCTSSVTFLPFMSILPAVYMSPFYVGESMSGLVPALFGLGQGVEIYNSTAKDAGTRLLKSARFSQNAFFAILGVLMFLCLLSYLYLSISPSMKKFYVQTVILIQHEHQRAGEHFFHASVESEYLGNSLDDRENLIPSSTINQRQNRNSIWFYLSCMLWLNLLQNGVMSSVGTYAYAPYGELAYHFGKLPSFIL